MKESDIKRQIMDYLDALPGAYFRVIQVSGIRGRKSPTKGVLDIIGCFQGRAIAIEVKTATGRLEASQEEFIRGWMKAGGLVILARSLGDVTSTLPPRLSSS